LLVRVRTCVRARVHVGEVPRATYGCARSCSSVVADLTRVLIMYSSTMQCWKYTCGIRPAGEVHAGARYVLSTHVRPGWLLCTVVAHALTWNEQLAISGCYSFVQLAGHEYGHEYGTLGSTHNMRVQRYVGVPVQKSDVYTAYAPACTDARSALVYIMHVHTGL
jgi:hypothetical protein